MNQHDKTVTWAILLPSIAVLIWSMNITVTRYVAEFISPVSISFYRWFFAFLILTPFMLKKAWQERHVIYRYFKEYAVLSAFGMVLYQGLAYSASHHTTATNMGIINAFVPIFTIFVSMFLLKEIPNWFAVIGSLLSFGGLLYVMGQGSLSSLLQLGQHSGDLLMVLAVFCYAFYGVFLKKWQLKVPLMLSLYIQIGFAILYHLPFIGYLGLDAIDIKNGPSVFYASIFASLIAPLVWMMAVQKIGPNQTSIFMNLMPVFTALIAYIWLGEAWTIYHTVGGGIILIGILLAQRKK